MQVMYLLENLQNDLDESIAKIKENLQINTRNSFLQGSLSKSPINKLADLIIDYAVKMCASDIHFEPQQDYLQIRFRIDGVLLLVYKVPQQIQIQLISYLKLMAGMDISEKRLPQDGSILYTKKRLDIRVSVIPVLFGEKIVMRLLSSDSKILSLSQMGFSVDNLHLFKRLIKSSSGIITITGPVNSGKSTLLYSVLNYLNTQNVNIVTIEDPIEMKINGINQMQVNLKAGMDFAKGLRAILRQDPDIVMIGEIRDEASAKEAVRAALTGHLVFTTLHTSNALGAVARLVDMNVKPSMLSIALAGSVAQRLVRKICPKCKEVYQPEENSLEALLLGKKFHAGMKLFKGRGCSFCNNSGYTGRIAVHEIMVLDDNIRMLIAKGEIDLKLKRFLYLNGMKTLRDDCCEKVLSGITTAQEVWRVLNGVYKFR